MEGNVVEPKTIKIELFGDCNVGKTVIGDCYLGKEFQNYKPLYPVGNGELETKFKLKNGEEIKLKIFEVNGTEKFKTITLKFLKIYKGIILIFDVTNKKSFDNIYMWMEEIKKNVENPNVILFANKVDIEKSKWEVTIEEAQQLAEKMQIPLFETSAKTKQGIMEGFSYIVNDSYDKTIVTNNNIIINNKDMERANNNSGCMTNKKK